ncbi:hypothetical protein [Acetonema longum]|uniref:S-layer domain protein n=1 Tax=Acetonema longum DSM 6540 TaxID=1009370 RepID=F7NJS4_9FIRM|nr:hypothetical protein [Acetonema longum]EGO63730.1 S-layer domain protein [Acetonema longum DSM 6540]
MPVKANAGKGNSGAAPAAPQPRRNGKTPRQAADAGAPPATSSGDIDPETHAALIHELMQTGQDSRRAGDKINTAGEVRYHYALNSGAGLWGQDISGFRARLAFDAETRPDWRIHGMLEGKRNILNYDNHAGLPYLFLEGKLGRSLLRAGSFSHLMAEGNIYDSGFDGIQLNFGEPVKYRLSYGETGHSKETAIATARYEDFDYNLEAGVYHYRTDTDQKNTIRSLGGNYNFSNFGVGATILSATLQDSQGDHDGYVLSFNYGGLKTWRPGTYSLFAKYYNQPQGTYIMHGMNGPGSRMQGFKGYGLGMGYTVAANFVAGLEYYDLSEKASGDSARTWWSYLMQYF